MSVNMTFDELCDKLNQANQNSYLVAVSGFGGSGKSTLATQLQKRLGSAEIVSGDDFHIEREEMRSDDWSTVDRARLIEQVLEPARNNTSISYQEYDWPRNAPGEWRHLKTTRFLIVEGLGIIHPDLLEFFNFSVWVDVPLEEAAERGRTRDREFYKVDHDALWRDLWVPNDRDYYERFNPDQLVDAIYKNKSNN